MILRTQLARQLNLLLVAVEVVVLRLQPLKQCYKAYSKDGKAKQVSAVQAEGWKQTPNRPTSQTTAPKQGLQVNAPFLHFQQAFCRLQLVSSVRMQRPNKKT